MGGGRRGRSIAAATAVLALASTAVAGAQLPPLTPPDPVTQPAPARIVYTAGGDLRTVSADGSDMRRLPGSGHDFFDNDAVWSPDGAWIAFTRTGLDSEHEDVQQVWVARADGSEARAITPANPNVYELGPSWSPDGRELAVVRVRVGRRRAVVAIAAVNVADGARRILHSEANGFDDESDESFFDSTAWSPRGDTILFARTTYGANSDEFRPAVNAVPAAGGQVRQVVADGGEPVWSPDASRIAYSASGEVYVANADGSAPVRLTRSRANDVHPTWSGDGARIAFESDRNSTQQDDEEAPPELYSIKPDGSCLTWLTNGTAHSSAPAFQSQPGLSSDPGGCGPTAREPLVETSMRGIDDRRRFQVWWFGPVAPNGLLLTDVGAERSYVDLIYDDCGRFDPAECGESQLVSSGDLCGEGASLGVQPRRLSLFRGALLHSRGDREFGLTDLYTHRTRVSFETASGPRPSRAVMDMLRPVGGERAAGASFPSTRLPARTWRGLKRRPAIAKRLAELGVKRRLGC